MKQYAVNISLHFVAGDILDAIYDVTVAYPYNFPQSEPQLIGGNFPKEVHFHVQRYVNTDLPKTEEELQQWCKSIWKQKEERLKHFYKNLKFSDKSSISPEDDRRAMFKIKLAAIYWSLLIIVTTLALIYFSLARWFILIQSVFFIFMSYRGGFELFQARYCNRFFSVKKKK